MTIIALDNPPEQPDQAAIRTVINVLTRERAIFEGNARRNRDAASYWQQQRIIAAFNTEITHLEQQLTHTQDEPNRTGVAA